MAFAGLFLDSGGRNRVIGMATQSINNEISTDNMPPQSMIVSTISEIESQASRDKMAVP